MTGAPPLIVVAGATATGKTDLGIVLAERLRVETERPTEIISADSRQVFRGLDIGTAKVGAAERARVPHHGLDLVDPDTSFTVADFATHATAVLADLAARDGIALLVGGTGFYLRAVARGLDTAALPADPEVRAALEGELIERGPEPLVARLLAAAPGLASGVDLQNPRRVVRALEIATLQGDTPLPTPRGYAGPVAWLGLRLEPPVHRSRIEARARAQFEVGLLEEARRLRTLFDPALPAFSAIGYREAWAVLDGESTLEAAIALDTQRNAAFAKRQRTWFRSEPDITWLDAGAPDATEVALAIVRRVLA
ncbi:MAG TPA: tRNA (adenosine(37)-N6)-dimethylallyltransferase MiaA [Candidatus Saccharimonadales bacterium]|nr:tRNA (adenosine(37)-N6)-dimethylallyltransferase MiaA [Candidatus Saccharimonadales bacterium]